MPNKHTCKQVADMYFILVSRKPKQLQYIGYILLPTLIFIIYSLIYIPLTFFFLIDLNRSSNGNPIHLTLLLKLRPHVCLPDDEVGEAGEAALAILTKSTSSVTRPFQILVLIISNPFHICRLHH